MTGYQEALTDPSFARQILAFTAPMIGNYGVEDAASESRRVQPTALICHEARNYAPNGRQGLLDWLREGGIVALSGLDTRALVRHLRDRGAMLAVACGEGAARSCARAARDEPRWRGRLLADEVSRRLGIAAVPTPALPRRRARLRRKSEHRAPGRFGRAVTVRAGTSATCGAFRCAPPRRRAARERPRRPGSMDAHVAEVRAMVDQGRPLYGICLGHQLLGRALGLETFKLPFGHRGAIIRS